MNKLALPRAAEVGKANTLSQLSDERQLELAGQVVTRYEFYVFLFHSFAKPACLSIVKAVLQPAPEAC